MNEILSVGLILVAAIAAGHLAQAIKLPEVTGYLIVGALIGPSALDVITTSNIEALRLLSEVALGLILFSIGAIFEVTSFRQQSRAIVRITLSETGATFVLVLAGMLLLGLPAAAALLLGVVAMETAPATTLMVLREYDSRGPLTNTILALLAANNMIVLAAFGVAAAVLTATTAGGTVYGSIYGVGWTILGSLALGVLVGLALDAWARRVSEPGEMMTLAVGAVLISVGAARVLGLSPLLASLAVGAVIANTAGPTDELLDGLRRADPPLYAAFFVLAGAELRFDVLPQIGIVGLIYAALRASGKLSGAWWATRRLALPPLTQRYLGMCLLSSSSLAIGLSIQIRELFPALAGDVTAVVLSAVILFEIVGPVMARMALVGAGEVPPPEETNDALQRMTPRRTA